jgi:hypothetical protein
MNRWQNRLIVIPADVPNTECRRVRDQFREGTYEPPAGWRLLSVTDNSDGITLLFERPIDTEPYRDRNG